MSKEIHSDWIDLPTPKFYDEEFAQMLVEKGYYDSMEEAYFELTDEQMTEHRARVDERQARGRQVTTWHEE